MGYPAAATGAFSGATSVCGETAGVIESATAALVSLLPTTAVAALAVTAGLAAVPPPPPPHPARAAAADVAIENSRLLIRSIQDVRAGCHCRAAAKQNK